MSTLKFPLSFILLLFTTCLACNQKNPDQTKTKDEGTGEFVSSDSTVTNGNITITTSTDTAKLKKILSFKFYSPKSVKYKYTYIDNSGSNSRTSIPGPSDFNLEAIMYFDSLTFSKFMESYSRADWVDPRYNKAEFNFNWLDTVTRDELIKSDTIHHGYIDLFWTDPNNTNCHIWMLNRKLLLHWVSN